MKIQDVLPLYEKEERSRENKDSHLIPAPGNLDQFITTAQAKEILDVETSGRVRQLIQDGRLKAKSPTKGQRDNLLKRSDVMAFAKKPRERTGRPDEGKGTSTKDKKKSKSKK